MRALVTGGCGFIGRHLVRTLIDAGHVVVVLDPSPPADLPPVVLHHRESILDEAALRSAMAGVDWVFHLAAVTQLWIPDKREYERINVVGTQLVLKAARDARARRIVHTSTEAVLSAAGNSAGVLDGSVDPAMDGQPGAYSRSKCAAELLALAAARDNQPVVVVSPTVPLGPGDTSLTPPSRMLLDFLNGRHLAYLDCLLNVVDVRDLAVGHVLAVERGSVGARYLLAGHDVRVADLLVRLQVMTGLSMPRRRIPYGLAWSVAAVSELVADLVTHRAPLASMNGVRLMRRPLACSARRARAELGWRTRPLDDTLADAIADMQARGLLARSRVIPSRSRLVP